MVTKQWTGSQIRATFLNFFKEREHKIVSSAPLVLKDDPTLMFTNAGMNQFKDFFLGYKQPDNPRIADTQKCLRVSGKHNDLEDVGMDTYHHTMFEMLGNWSIGDYFKKDAIAWAWELLTGVYGISKDQLYVTIFEGDQKENLERDQEAYDLWKQWIDESRIINGNKKDNFWEMGETGPCGPCSEIHVDIRPLEDRKKIDGKTLVNQDHPQVVEVWNLVFMQFNRKANGSLEKLPASHIDTGMGFERLAMVLQGTQSNYDTDVFMPLIAKIEQMSGKKYAGTMEKSDIAMRVISDHIRAISFAIADGQLPSNSGAGYVIRRILRRAVRYGYSFLDVKEPFIHQLVDVLSAQMGEAFPELPSQKELIQKVIQEEENSFLRTLQSGLNRLDGIISEAKSRKENQINGAQAFELYDTYGFPLDLTMLIASENGLTVDELGFNTEMTKQKERSRQDAKVETGDWVILQDGNCEFIGYDSLEAEVKVIRHRTMKQKGKDVFQIVLNKTPFYAESGGQVGDKGILQIGDEQIPIYDTKKENDLIIHYVKSLPKAIEQVGTAKVDTKRRALTENNHSATHLLHSALRAVLGDHVHQKGSLVNSDKLRFDFSHFGKMTAEEIEQVEEIVNAKIVENIYLQEDRSVPFQEAIDKGAMALFGEKYGDEVRVITFDPNYSVELCGGTHVKSTAQIRLFKIASESASSAGIRRIEALTGNAAVEYYKQQEEMVKTIASLLKNDKNTLKAVENLVKENESLATKIESFVAQQASQVKADLKQSVLHENGLNLITKVVELGDAEALKNIAFELRNELENLVFVVGANINNKPLLSVMISDNLVEEKGYNAGKIIRELAKEIKGGGGGQAFYATAGGKDVSGLQNAIDKVREML